MDVNVVRAAGRPDIIPNNEISHIVNTWGIHMAQILYFTRNFFI
jgi:hypothetical protein